MLFSFCLIAIFAFTDATPVGCENRFYNLYKEIDAKKSACHLIQEFKGSFYTIDVCRENACKEGGNVINFKQTSDDYDDNICQVLSCEDGDLKIINDPDHQGFSVSLLDAEEELQCSAANKRLLTCWTCDVMNDESCELFGTMEPCTQESGKCFYYSQTTPSGVQLRVMRGCMAADQCTDSMYGNVGECEFDQVYNHSNCKKCGYGFEDRKNRCYPRVRPVEEAKVKLGQRDWVQIMLKTDGKAVNCPLLAQETSYSLRSCQKLALVVGGNVVAHRYAEHCKVYKCELTQSGIDDLKLTDITHGWGIYTLASEIPCTYIADRTLSCLTCDEKNDNACWRKGKMNDCEDPDSVCLHHRKMTFGMTVRVKRGCVRRSECTKEMWDPDYNAACKYTTEHAQGECKTCLFGTHGQYHGCHALFDTACIKNFEGVKPDRTKRQMTQSCIQLATQKNHWKKSCLNLACLTNANVVHFNEGICEVYNCQLNEGEEYIFRSKRNRKLQIYISKH